MATKAQCDAFLKALVEGMLGEYDEDEEGNAIAIQPALTIQAASNKAAIAAKGAGAPKKK